MTNLHDEGPDDGPVVRRPHAVLRYTTLRLAIFVAVLLLLWLVRIHNGVLLVAIALIVSGLASYVLLGSQRDAMAAQLQAGSVRRRDRSKARAAREDDDLDYPDSQASAP